MKLIASLVSIRTRGGRDSQNSLSAFVRRTRSESGNCSKRRFATKLDFETDYRIVHQAVSSRTSTRSVIQLR